MLRSYISALAPLAGALEGREARAALAAAFGALAAGPLPELQQTAELVAGMTAMSASAVSCFPFVVYGSVNAVQGSLEGGMARLWLRRLAW